MAGALVALLAMSEAGCRRSQPVIVIDEEENAGVASSIDSGNERVASQFVGGFHAIEGNSYRWTMGKFSVVLQSPPSHNGAKLVLRFCLPEPVIARRKAVTLSASVEGLSLSPALYTAAGDYTYTRDLPASSLPDRPVKIDFSLDRYLAAGEIEPRELGITVLRVALERGEPGDSHHVSGFRPTPHPENP